MLVNLTEITKYNNYNQLLQVLCKQDVPNIFKIKKVLIKQLLQNTEANAKKKLSCSKVVRKCSRQKVFLKFCKLHRKITDSVFLSDKVKGSAFKSSFPHFNCIKVFYFVFSNTE